MLYFIENKKAIDRIQTERLGKAVSIFIGTFFSPAWVLMKFTLNQFLAFDELSGKNGTQLDNLIQLIARIEDLGSFTLLFQLVPLLTLCLLCSFGFLFLCGKLGETLAGLAYLHLAKFQE